MFLSSGITILLHSLVHRSLRHTVESLRRNMIAPLERLGPVEVFYHSWDVAELRNPRAGEAYAEIDSSIIGQLLPEAKGLIEPQEDYVRTLDWERLSRRNPMRHCTNGEEAAALTLRNYLLALESQQRVWRVFEEQRGSRRPGLMVATRADLRFLDELEVPEVLVAALCERRGDEDRPDGRFIGIDGHRPPLQAPHRPPPKAALWLPKFHAWGGVNDRFAIGNEEAIRIWSNRVAFAEEWLERSKGESPEWLLMKCLEKNRVRVGFLDFTFQRVRANGEVAERDRELKARADKGIGSERFLILAREIGTMTENLRRMLEPLGRVEVIVDCPPDTSPALTLIVLRSATPRQAERRYIHLSAGEAEGYGGLMSDSFPQITAWSRAFAHLARTLEENEAVWIVEDDVAGDADSFAELVRATTATGADLSALDIRTRHEDADWPWWSYAEGLLPSPCRAFQPLCRLSGRLLRAVLDFQKRHQRFTFHEVLFASLAQEHGMTSLDWRKDASTKGLVAGFHYRPEVNEVRRGVLHPVKDPQVHRAICCLPSVGTSRRHRAACEGWSILSDDYDFLQRFCREQGFRSAVEFGPGDSTLALLDGGCRIISYEHDLVWLQKTLGKFSGEDGVEIRHCPEGCLPEPPDARPDLVLVDGPPFREGQKMSRLAPCEWALEVCGCFLLHDSKRSGELATLAEMERRGMRVIHICTKKGLALVVDPSRRPELLPMSHHTAPIAGSNRFATSWLATQIDSWCLWIGDRKWPAKVLTTAVESMSDAIWLMDALYPDEQSQLHVISPGDEGIPNPTATSTNECPNSSRQGIHWYQGEAREILAWMIAGDGFWENFEFIHLGESRDSRGLLSDACQAWSLLKPGGHMMIEANSSTVQGMKAFSSVFDQDYEVLVAEPKRILVRKRQFHRNHSVTLERQS